MDGTARSDERREVSYHWPTAEVDKVRQTFDAARPRYRQLRQPELGRARLTMSALCGEAYRQARAEQATWLGTVRPSGLRSPAEVTRPMGFSWSLTLLDEIEEDFERLEAAAPTLWGAGFRITRAHLILAGVQHGLKTNEWWLHLVPNDGRFSPRRQVVDPGDDPASPDDAAAWRRASHESDEGQP